MATHVGSLFRHRSYQSKAIKFTACALFFSSSKPLSSAFVTDSSEQIGQKSSLSLFKKHSSPTASKLFSPLCADKDISGSFSCLHSTMSASSTLTVAQFPCLDDNYGYLIHDPSTGDTAAVDTPDGETYQNELNKRGWKLSHIFNTHHHWDHTGANLDLKKANNNVKIFGPKSEEEKIPGIDVGLEAGSKIAFGNTEATVIDVGGHTNGHIALHFPEDHILFAGDALFALGCGRMFEGTPSQYWESLKRLRTLPDETVMYCAHEYTLSNSKFAMSVESGNKDLIARNEEVVAKRSRGEPTVPSTLGDEKKTNPFLRVDLSSEIQKNVGAVDGEEDYKIFAKVRKAKDTFRG